MDCFGTAISICLQYGVPLDVLVDKFSHTRFEPMGYTGDPDIMIAKSLVDYIFRWLEKTFLPREAEAEDQSDHLDNATGRTGERENSQDRITSGQPARPELHDHNRNEQFARFQSDAPSCDNCGAITVRNGNCYVCHNCGNSLGCS